MGFLSNKPVNYLNLHNGFVEMLNQIMLVFGAPFLLQHGLSMEQVFFTYGLISCGRILSRFLVFPVLKTIGLQKTVALGLAGFGSALSLLSQVRGMDGWFVAFIAVFILLNPMYWLCFHIYYTLMGDEKHRGKQYAVRGVIILSGQALFPLISAGFIRWLGYSWYFTLAIPVTIAALTFLLLSPDTGIPRRSWICSRKQLGSVGVRTGVFQSLYEGVSNNFWVFILFLFFDGRVVTFSSVIAFGIAMQIIIQLLIGHRFDSGHARQLTTTGGMAMSATILGRALAPLSVPVILFLELFNSVARLHVRSVVEIATYNDSHRAEHIVWYWVFTEMARDTGNILGTWSAALLLFSGFEPRTAILIALPALLGLWFVLTRVMAK